MKKIAQTIAIILLFLVASTTFTACELSDIFGQNSNESAQEIGIHLDGEIKLSYYVGENFDANGAKLMVSYDDETEKQYTLLDSMISGFDSSTVGLKTLTITYKTFSITKNYNIIDIPVYTSDGAIYSMYDEMGTGNYSYFKIDLTNSKLYTSGSSSLPDLSTYNWEDTEQVKILSFVKSRTLDGDTLLTSEWYFYGSYSARVLLSSITTSHVNLTQEVAGEINGEVYTLTNPYVVGPYSFSIYN